MQHKFGCVIEPIEVGCCIQQGLGDLELQRKGDTQPGFVEEVWILHFTSTLIIDSNGLKDRK